MEIDDLSVLSHTFDEDEEKALGALPRNKKACQNCYLTLNRSIA